MRVSRIRGSFTLFFWGYKRAIQRDRPSGPTDVGIDGNRPGPPSSCSFLTNGAVICAVMRRSAARDSGMAPISVRQASCRQGGRPGAGQRLAAEAGLGFQQSAMVVELAFRCIVEEAKTSECK